MEKGKHIKRIIILLFAVSSITFSQSTENVGIGTLNPDNSALLHLDVSGNSTKRGLLIPTMTAAQRNSITNPAKGLIVFVTDDNNFYFNSGTSGTPIWTVILAGTTSINFQNISSGTNTSAAMIVGNGASLSTTGTGIIQANQFAGPGSLTNAVDLETSEISGILSITKGGTGLTSSPTNGQILIGNGIGYTLNSLSAGNGITISNGSGTIQISANVSAIDHNNLNNVQIAGMGITNGHINDQSQTIAGAKSFISNISAPSYISTITTGTSPFTINSTTLVSNLNVDMLDGKHSTDFLLTSGLGNLTSTTNGVTISGGTNAVIGTGTSIKIDTASGTKIGLLSSSDWISFNNKQNTLTAGTGINIAGNTISNTGDLSGNNELITSITWTDGTDKLIITEAGTNHEIAITGFESSFTKGNLSSTTTGLTITGGANAVIGTGTEINIATANSTESGLLSSSDWTTFNSKQPSGNYITALTGDITASGPGSAVTTIAQQGATNGQVLKWDGIEWNPADDLNTLYTAGSGISITGNVINNIGDIDASDDITTSTLAGGDLSGNYPNPSVIKLQGRNVSTTAPVSGQLLRWNSTTSTWEPSDDNTLGTVTSVGLTLPSEFSVTNSPITDSGNLNAVWNSQNQNFVFASPVSTNGVPSFRLLDTADIPNLSTDKLTIGTLTVPRGGSGVGSITGMIKGNGTTAYSGITAKTGQITFWSDDNTIGGHDSLTWDSSSKTFSIGGDLVVTGIIDPKALILIPQISQPTNKIGAIYYDEPTNKLKIITDNGPETILTGSLSGNDWSLSGNSGTIPGTDFIGTTDDEDFVIKTDGIERFRVMSNTNGGFLKVSEGIVVNAASEITGNLTLKNNGIASELRISEPSGNGNNYVSLSAPSLSNDVKFILPATIGIDGQFLQTDGNGNLTWGNPTGGNLPTGSENQTLRYGTEWETSSFLVNTGSMIGINISTPTSSIHQDGGNGTATYHKFTAGLTTGTTVNDGFDIGIDGNGNAKINLKENNDLIFSTLDNERARITNNGKFLINTATMPDDSILVKQEGDLQIAGDLIVSGNSKQEILGLNPRSSSPGSPKEGMTYYNSQEKVLKLFDGTDWLTIDPRMPVVLRASLLNNYDIPSENWEKITFDSTTFDSHSAYNSGKFTVPITGFYNIYSQVTAEIDGGGFDKYLLISIYKNGSLLTEGSISFANNDSPSYSKADISELIYLEENEYLEIFVKCKSSDKIAIGQSTFSYLTIHQVK